MLSFTRYSLWLARLCKFTYLRP